MSQSKKLALACLAALLLGVGCGGGREIYHDAPPLSQAPGDETLQTLAPIVACALNGSAPPPSQSLLEHPGTALILAYREGVLLSRRWSFGASWSSAAYQAGALVRHDLDSARPDALYLCVGYNYRQSQNQQLSDYDQGLEGVEMSSPQEVRALFPIETITGGVAVTGWCRESARELNNPRFYQFDALQGLLKPSSEGPEFNFQIQLLRRGRVLPSPALTRRVVEEMHSQLAGFLLREVSLGNGMLAYRYDPRHDLVCDQGLILVRSMMATWALADLAQQEGGAFEEGFKANWEATLKAYYRPSRGTGGPLVGHFVHEKENDLGSAALASLALQAHGGGKTSVGQELDRALDAQWSSSGEFVDPVEPVNQDFSPGEALLATSDRWSEKRFLESFRFYQLYYENRHTPAFIPWHTMAECRWIRRSKDPELESSVYQMNDDLLKWMQPLGGAADLDGAFYCQGPHPLYGRRQRPHASASAVYLDGLADAYALARERGQAPRAEKYRRAILRGLLSLRNWQYSNSEDLAYLSPTVRQRVMGGLRSSPWHQAMRIDNEAHAVLALAKILRVFRADDFGPSGRVPDPSRQ